MWSACIPAVELILLNLFHRKNSGRLPIYLKEFVQEGVKNMPLSKRPTQQKLGMSMGVLKTMVHHWIVAATIHVHCNALKPILTEEKSVMSVSDQRKYFIFYSCQDKLKYSRIMKIQQVLEKLSC